MTLLFVTDLDGTLLDHSSYSHAPAQPALDALRAARIPLVLASSKTAAEMRALHRELGLGATPAIVENGAGVMDPNAPEAFDGGDYRRMRAALDALPGALRRAFRGFGDMSEAEVAEITGLSATAAQAARTRAFSEPGLWSGNETDLMRFCALLGQSGIVARQGGRFLTLSFGRTKADALKELVNRLGARFVVALGDAPNDTEMLEAADIGVVIRNDVGADLPPLKGEGTKRIRRTQSQGPAGWNRAVLEILEEMHSG